MSHDLNTGDVLDNRFKIAGLIARSGMASIFKATDVTDGATVAIKVPAMQYECDPAFYSRFEREESIGKLLRHPYIIRIVPVEDKSRPYIAMEYLEGQTLGKRLKEAGPFAEPEALALASKVCDALSHMHTHASKIIHRDLKPDNIMLCTDGSIRIMDFGIAKAGLRKITFVGFSPSLGTPDYMAPEQVKGQRGDERTDIYGLGAILYEVVTGHVPFEGDNPHVIMNSRVVGDPPAPRKHNPDLSPQLEEIILHAMARNPADRYTSAEALKQDLASPEKVALTGRCDRLQPPNLQQVRWRGWRVYVLAIIIPIVLVVLFLILFRKP